MLEAWLRPIRDHLPLWLMLVPAVGAVSALVSRRFGAAATRQSLYGTLTLSAALCLWMVAAYEPLKPTETREQFVLFGPIERVQFRSGFSWIGETRSALIQRPTRNGDLRDVEVLTHWGPDIRFETGVDGISIWFVALSVLSITLAVLRTTRLLDQHDPPASGSHDHSLARRANSPTLNEQPLAAWLLLEASLVGAFVALDAVLFVVCWMSSLLLGCWLLGSIGNSDRHEATPLLVKAHWLGGWLVALGVGGLVLAFGWLRESVQRPQPPLLFSIPEITAGIQHWTTAGDNLYLWVSVSPWLFWLLVVGFTWPLLLVPFHRAFAASIAAAPPSLAIVLVCVLAKLGLFGWLRFVMPIFSDLVLQNKDLLVTTFGMTSFFAAFLALQQPSWSGRIALATSSSIGLSLLGLATSSMEGLTGGALRVVSHGLTAALLLWLLPDRDSAGTVLEPVQNVPRSPRTALRFVLFAWIGMPGLSGFLPEFLTPFSLLPQEFNAATLSLATSGLIAWMWVRTEREMPLDAIRPWRPLDHFVVMTLVGLNIALGMAPQYVIDRLQPSLLHLLPAKEITAMTALSRIANSPKDASMNPTRLRLRPTNNGNTNHR